MLVKAEELQNNSGASVGSVREKWINALVNA
jgi:hypothetical protein